MTTKCTKIVVGRVGDNFTSAETTVADENFVSVLDTPVNLVHGWATSGYQTLIVSGTVVVKNLTKTTTYDENDDYTIDYNRGTITVKSGETMADATHYYINYHYVQVSLAYKINQVTSAAVSVQYICTCRAGQNGVATILYTTA